MDKRQLQRIERSQIDAPVSLKFRVGDHHVVGEVVNYHFKGACIRIPLSTLTAKERALIRSDALLDFYFGEKCIAPQIPFRICWESEDSTWTFGIEFQKSVQDWIERDLRIPVHPQITPTLSAKDPLDPNRTIFFQVRNVSKGGMLITTSLTNKHIFPGMRLKNAQLSIPGQATVDLDELVVATTLPPNEESSNQFYLGISIRNPSNQYHNALREYLAALSSKTDAPFESDLEKAGFGLKGIAKGLTFRTITTQSEYDKILRLRYRGYSKHGKVKTGATWRDMGDGLDNEGVIVGGYLGGKLIASAEYRFGADTKGLRYIKEDTQVPEINLIRAMEVNKLVIDPAYQGSDIIVGLAQKSHSVALSKGALDVLLTATDKLAPLYERMGFDRLNIKIPHPTLSGEHLNILLGKSEKYTKSGDVNPYIWNALYKNVHEWLVEANIAAPVKPTLWAKSRSTLQILTKQISKQFKTIKTTRHHKSSVETGTQSSESSTFITPKWTKQDFAAHLMAPYLTEADKVIGPAQVDAILKEIGITRNYIHKKSNWLSIEFFDEFHDKYAMLADLEVLSRKAGKRALSKEVLGLDHFVLKHLLTPEAGFRAHARIGPKFNRTRTYRILDAGHGRIRLAVGLAQNAKLPKYRVACENFCAIFEAFVELMTGKAGRVEHTSCMFDGAHHCIFDVKWTPKNQNKINNILLAVLASSSLLFFNFLKNRQIDTSAWLTTCFAGLLTILYLYFRLRNKHNEASAITKAFDEYQTESSERYSELQSAKQNLDRRYQEALLIERTSQEIQLSADLQKILKVSLEAACTMLGFSRAFVMLVDESGKKLQTAAVVGATDNIPLVWQYSVDVSAERNNPLLLSSVYKSGTPVIVDNVAAHLFQLNESSQQLIKTLKSTGFVMVAVPSASKNWGVIIADKTGRTANLTDHDLVLLQRVAQQLGLTLDKVSQLEREKNIRRLFETYVPSAIKAQSETAKPALGGQQREIVCLFLDIRDFTKHADSLPPQGIIKLLNSLFSFIDEIVVRHGGVIEKFLGDGLLAVWGLLGETESTSDRPVNAALELLHRLPELNQTLSDAGLPKIRVGIGLNRGVATVGNIGSDKRMDFTCIGTMVNVASRLEGLCKQYGTDLVVSEAILNSTSINLLKRFQNLNNVTIRGIEHPMKIGVYIMPDQNTDICQEATEARTDDGAA